jgi:hypothetical protein
MHDLDPLFVRHAELAEELGDDHPDAARAQVELGHALVAAGHTGEGRVVLAHARAHLAAADPADPGLSAIDAALAALPAADGDEDEDEDGDDEGGPPQVRAVIEEDDGYLIDAGPLQLRLTRAEGPAAEALAPHGPDGALAHTLVASHPGWTRAQKVAELARLAALPAGALPAELPALLDDLVAAVG